MAKTQDGSDSELAKRWKKQAAIDLRAGEPAPEAAEALADSDARYREAVAPYREARWARLPLETDDTHNGVDLVSLPPAENLQLARRNVANAFSDDGSVSCETTPQTPGASDQESLTS